MARWKESDMKIVSSNYIAEQFYKLTSLILTDKCGD